MPPANPDFKFLWSFFFFFFVIVLEDPSSLTKSFLCLKGTVLFWPRWEEALVFLI